MKAFKIWASLRIFQSYLMWRSGKMEKVILKFSGDGCSLQQKKIVASLLNVVKRSLKWVKCCQRSVLFNKTESQKYYIHFKNKCTVNYRVEQVAYKKRNRTCILSCTTRASETNQLCTSDAHRVIGLVLVIFQGPLTLAGATVFRKDENQSCRNPNEKL